MDSVEEGTFDESRRYAFKQMTVSQHKGHCVFGIAYKRHGCTSLMCRLPSVERLVGKIVLHRVNEHGIHIPSLLLFKLIPCHHIPIANKTKILFISLYLYKQSGTRHITARYKHTVWRQFLKDMRLTRTLRTQFHEVEIVLYMR